MSPRRFSEDELVERPAVELLAELGWETVNAREEVLGPGGTLGRSSRRDVVLEHRLLPALRALNPEAPAATLEEAAAVLSRDRSLLEPTRASREVYDLLRDGYLAAWRDDDGEQRTARIDYLDLRDPVRNEWLAANQVWIAGELHTRRVDLVLFVNGIPFVLAEFKEPGRSVRAAFDENLTDYRDTIPQLFWPNAFVISRMDRQRGSAPHSLHGSSSGNGSPSMPRERAAASSSRRRSGERASPRACSTSSRTSSLIASSRAASLSRSRATTSTSG